MNVVIDPDAGFCFGVEKAIHVAEASLGREEKLFCLGEIVHNELETGRLKKMGLKVIDHETYKTLKDATVLIRAHGEPPETYIYAKENNIRLIEATCPVVLKLQQRVQFAHQHLSEGGQLVIAGKPSHPEVISLQGQTGGEAIVIESPEEIDKIDFTRPVEIFSQTTLSRQKFDEMIKAIRRHMDYEGHNSALKVNRTICGQVANRMSKLEGFCRQNDVILFVSGKNSSNGKALFEACKKVNPESYHISSPEEIQEAWFQHAESVGISGATSTPPWLMKEIAMKLRAL